MFAQSLVGAAAAVAAHLESVLDEHEALPVVEAMGYATRGGKALRGYLVLESARLHGVPEGHAIWPAFAIEAVHAYSLVHDDLPCMDNDDLEAHRCIEDPKARTYIRDPAANHGNLPMGSWPTSLQPWGSAFGTGNCSHLHLAQPSTPSL